MRKRYVWVWLTIFILPMALFVGAMFQWPLDDSLAFTLDDRGWAREALKVAFQGLTFGVIMTLLCFPFVRLALGHAHRRAYAVFLTPFFLFCCSIGLCGNTILHYAPLYLIFVANKSLRMEHMSYFFQVTANFQLPSAVSA